MNKQNYFCSIQVTWYVNINCFCDNIPIYFMFSNVLYYVKSVQKWNFFWSVLSNIGTEYGKIRSGKNIFFAHFSLSAGEHRKKLEYYHEWYK